VRLLVRLFLKVLLLLLLLLLLVVHAAGVLLRHD
jgi:hypothetical protein